MVTYDGVVKIVDFGIAKVVGSNETAHGVFKGKVSYMAPEQVLCHAVDRRSDVFAAGIVLWEAVTGERLMADKTPAKTLHNVLSKVIPRASSIKEIPAVLDDIIAKALERDIDQRFASAKCATLSKPISPTKVRYVPKRSACSWPRSSPRFARRPAAKFARSWLRSRSCVRLRASRG